MQIVIERGALKALSKIPAKERTELLAKVQAFAHGDPLTPKVLKRFSETTGRIRHGDFRAVYRIVEHTDTLFIEAASHRKDVYK